MVRKNSCHIYTYTFLIQYVRTRIAQKVKGVAISQFNFPQKEELLIGVPPSSHLISTCGSFTYLRADLVEECLLSFGAESFVFQVAI